MSASTMHLWAKLHSDTYKPGHEREFGADDGVAFTSITENISPSVIEKMRRSRALNNLKRPHRNIQGTTTTKTKAKTKNSCMNMNVSANHIGRNCWRDIWQKEGCVGIPRYTDWIANRTFAELTAHAQSMFNASDNQSLRACLGKDGYSQRWCLKAHERNTTAETDIGPICWTHFWRMFGCIEPTETFTKLESIAKFWATMPDTKHVQGCYGKGEPLRREVEFGRLACDVVTLNPDFRKTNNIGKECWAYLWHKAGCTQPAPAYSKWHATQTFTALEDDTYVWARSRDEVHVRNCHGIVGLDALNDERRAAVRFARN